MVRVRFASVNRVTKDAIHVHFVLPRVLESARFNRVEAIGKVWVHHLRLARDEDFDEELAGWLAASYEEYGEQRAQGTSKRSSKPSMRTT